MNEPELVASILKGDMPLCILDSHEKIISYKDNILKIKHNINLGFYTQDKHDDYKLTHKPTTNKIYRLQIQMSDIYCINHKEKLEEDYDHAIIYLYGNLLSYDDYISTIYIYP